MPCLQFLDRLLLVYLEDLAAVDDRRGRLLRLLALGFGAIIIILLIDPVVDHRFEPCEHVCVTVASPEPRHVP